MMMLLVFLAFARVALLVRGLLAFCVLNTALAMGISARFSAFKPGCRRSAGSTSVLR